MAIHRLWTARRIISEAKAPADAFIVLEIVNLHRYNLSCCSARFVQIQRSIFKLPLRFVSVSLAKMSSEDSVRKRIIRTQSRGVNWINASNNFSTQIIASFNFIIIDYLHFIKKTNRKQQLIKIHHDWKWSILLKLATYFKWTY